jgi:hypothetical protein
MCRRWSHLQKSGKAHSLGDRSIHSIVAEAEMTSRCCMTANDPVMAKSEGATPSLRMGQ